MTSLHELLGGLVVNAALTSVCSLAKFPSREKHILPSRRRAVVEVALRPLSLGQITKNSSMSIRNIDYRTAPMAVIVPVVITLPVLRAPIVSGPTR